MGIMTIVSGLGKPEKQVVILPHLPINDCVTEKNWLCWSFYCVTSHFSCNYSFFALRKKSEGDI